MKNREEDGKREGNVREDEEELGYIPKKKTKGCQRTRVQQEKELTNISVEVEVCSGNKTTESSDIEDGNSVEKIQRGQHMYDD